MNLFHIPAAMLTVLSLAGYESIVSGVHQDISINTSSEGAKYVLYRKDVQVDYANSTPGVVSVSRKGSNL